jgi:hypothetical protein
MWEDYYSPPIVLFCIVFVVFVTEENEDEHGLVSVSVCVTIM